MNQPVIEKTIRSITEHSHLDILFRYTFGGVVSITVWPFHDMLSIHRFTGETQRPGADFINQF